ncbi:branched-chain amino acid ABC transporter permease [Actibacterium sp. D379-3]
MMLFLLMAAAFIVAPLFVYPVIMMKIMCFGLLVLGFNQLLGYTGLISFGHAMFLGWGGYVAAVAAKSWGFPPEACLLVGGVVGAMLGLGVGALAIRRQGIYFAMITLAFAQMFYFFAVQAPFTGGEDGIQAVPRGRLFGVIDLSDTTAMYGFVLVTFLLGFLAIYRIIHSPFGEILVAIRENEQRAISLGYNVDLYKLLAFVLSASVAGVAGALKVLVFQLASLSDVHWSMSGEILLMTLVGGVGTIFGPVLGAAVIVSLQNFLSGFGAWVPVVQGVVFVATVLLFRQGLAGGLGRLADRLRGKSATAGKE